MTKPTTADYRKWFDANMSDDIELYEISRNMLDRLEAAEATINKICDEYNQHGYVSNETIEALLEDKK